MKIHQSGELAYVIRQAVMASIVYVGACSLWLLWILCTAEYPLIGSPGPSRLISGMDYAGGTLANSVLGIALIISGLQSRKSSPGCSLRLWSA